MKKKRKSKPKSKNVQLLMRYLNKTQTCDKEEEKKWS